MVRDGVLLRIFSLVSNCEASRCVPTVQRSLTVAVLWTLAAGCSLPDSMQVRRGNEPRYQDEDVRFRTTYYFRVFDYCRDKASRLDTGNHQPFVAKVYTEPDQPPAPQGRGNATDSKQPQIKIVSDALYRFRVTGKADSLFEDIRFEAGTLKADEIDPFGAQAAVRCRPGGEGCEVAKPDGGAQAASSGSDGAADGLICAGDDIKRGFQIIGPEGVTNFNQDERLVIAMGTGVSPLSTLKQLANHQQAELIAQGQGVSLALANETARILDARKALDGAAAANGAEALRRAIAALNR